LSLPLSRPYVRLDVFDGPLDLLLYLVHNQELNPRTINVSEIADQYMQFLQSDDAPELGLAGEYLVMAAKLLALKARELLPREEQGELEAEEYDMDREELIRQLIEYRRFKLVAEQMRGMEAKNSASLVRTFDETRPPKDEAPPEEIVGIWDLLKAFREVLKVKPRTAGHVIEVDDLPIEERMNQMRARMLREGRVLFDELVTHDSRRLVVVVTFMSLMELVKTEEVVFRQERDKGAIVLYRRNDTRFEDELANATRVISEDPETNPNIAGLLEERERMRVESLAREEAEWGLLSRILEGFADGKVPLDIPDEDEDPDPVLAATPLGTPEEAATTDEATEPAQDTPNDVDVAQAIADADALAADLTESVASQEWEHALPDDDEPVQVLSSDADALPEIHDLPMLDETPESSLPDTLVLEPGAYPFHVVVPGIGNSGPENWQSLLESELERVGRVQQRDWDAPFMPEWTHTLDLLLESLPPDPILIGHSAGVMTIVQWAMRHDRPIRGALLVAPPDFEGRLPEGFPPPEVVAQAGWAPIPRQPLPFPSIVVASTTDPFCTIERAREFAQCWGSQFVDLGDAGHINTDSGYGPWPFAQELLARL
jgi:predicted alpha/beta hydrolase family esterase/chromatin segregation and condensation protein Rec8/ScpA/Scc1 (kleisin family)